MARSKVASSQAPSVEYCRRVAGELAVGAVQDEGDEQQHAGGDEAGAGAGGGAAGGDQRGEQRGGGDLVRGQAAAGAPAGEVAGVGADAEGGEEAVAGLHGRLRSRTASSSTAATRPRRGLVAGLAGRRGRRRPACRARGGDGSTPSRTRAAASASGSTSPRRAPAGRRARQRSYGAAGATPPAVEVARREPWSRGRPPIRPAASRCRWPRRQRPWTGRPADARRGAPCVAADWHQTNPTADRRSPGPAAAEGPRARSGARHGAPSGVKSPFGWPLRQRPGRGSGRGGRRAGRTSRQRPRRRRTAGRSARAAARAGGRGSGGRPRRAGRRRAPSASRAATAVPAPSASTTWNPSARRSSASGDGDPAAGGPVRIAVGRGTHSLKRAESVDAAVGGGAAGPPGTTAEAIG